MLKYLHTIFFAGLLFLTSCDRKLDREGLTNYINNKDNGLLHEKSIGDIFITAQYKPHDLIALQFTDSLKGNVQHQFDSIKKALEYHYIILNISKNNEELLGSVNNGLSFKEMVYRLSFDMYKYVTLYTSDYDTIPLIDYSAPRFYGYSNTTPMQFIFAGFDPEKCEWFRLELNEFGLITGDLTFQFNSKDISDIPLLNINNE